MRKKFTFAYHHLQAKLRARKTTSDKIRAYLTDRHVAGQEKVQSATAINQKIFQMIKSNEPFMAGRFGAVELSTVRTFDFQINTKYKIVLSQLKNNAGFFSADCKSVINFTQLMLKSIPEVDVMGIWALPFEDYYLNHYGKKDLLTTYLLDLEPWSAPQNPWTAALEGKKVLVIHPFAETIKKQYEKRELLFPDTDILPKFQLKTLKAVQTVAGQKDERFATWFDALEWMYQEALKVDFDVAIIGCGAYGFPLAAKLKQAGKQAIHLAGATQLLFGIKGRRWEENDAFSYVQKFFNDAWVYPAEEDKPKNAEIVEGGCYW